MVMMKKRYVKRVIRKAVFFILTILFLALLTSMIVERRLKKESKVETPVELDPNGDPVTAAFVASYIIEKPRRHPRPPVQLHEEPVQPIEVSLPEEELDYELYDIPQDKQHIPRGMRQDWNDYGLMKAESIREGLGEHGEPVKIEDERLRDMEKEMYLYNGFNALVSDRISVNRSLPDVRIDGCKTKKYLAKLPTISVVIPCYNEHFSVLLRSLHSIVNRTPRELLQQIVVVDDFSDRQSLKTQLDDYVYEYFPNLVQIVRLTERTGLIGARMAGARAAKGDVLVFFDSHIECNHNWLPPLLEPIAINPNISTCPIVDVIDHSNFEYRGGSQLGSRGAFDWNFGYRQLPLPDADSRDVTHPYRNPIMMGGLFAIKRDFFWTLGGYDEGLEIWGAEQYELSFKIWMCGGILLDVPCSRVAHVFRGPMNGRPNPRNYSFVSRNFKRVAEVWLDDYKQYIYKRKPSEYEIDAGDLSQQIANRARLQCKSFQWFLDEVAPDLVQRFPPEEPPFYASGVIQNVLYDKLCLDTMGESKDSPVGLYSCAENKTHPQPNQFWVWEFGSSIRNNYNEICLDCAESHENAEVWLWACHGLKGNQFWYYDRQQQWIVHRQSGHTCLEAVKDEQGKRHVYTNRCDKDNQGMKWIFGQLNNTAIEQWEQKYMGQS